MNPEEFEIGAAIMRYRIAALLPLRHTNVRIERDEKWDREIPPARWHPPARLTIYIDTAEPGQTFCYVQLWHAMDWSRFFTERYGYTTLTEFGEDEAANQATRALVELVQCMNRRLRDGSKQPTAAERADAQRGAAGPTPGGQGTGAVGGQPVDSHRAG